jgi:hypothetical protein
MSVGHLSHQFFRGADRAIGCVQPPFLSPPVFLVTPCRIAKTVIGEMTPGVCRKRIAEINDPRRSKLAYDTSRDFMDAKRRTAADNCVDPVLAD